MSSVPTGAPETHFPAHSSVRPATLLLVFIASLSPLSMHIYLPSLPGLAVDLQATDAQVQLTLSVYLFAVAGAQLLIGPLSDRYGRRPILLAGLVVFLIATLFCRFANTIEALIIARGFQAIGGCTGMVLGRAIVRDISTRRGAASLLGYVTMGMALAQMAGPAMGGFLDGFYGWRASFDLLLILGCAIFAVVFFALRETNLTPQKNLAPRTLITNHKALAFEPRFWAYAATGGLASGVFFAFLGGGPLILQREMGISPLGYGLYFTIVALGYAGGNYISGRFSEQLGTRRMITMGNGIALMGIALAVPLVGVGLMHPLVLFGPVLISSFANGLSLPSAFAGALSVRPDLAGTASGMAGSLQLCIAAIATVIVGAVIHLGIWSLVIVMLILAVAALLVGLAANRMETAVQMASGDQAA
jgi:DHA1 family bicyclomycin/chloramphenicol resistance-like MFS transporter